MKRDLDYWRSCHRSGGWREVLRCLNCVYGPDRWASAMKSQWSLWKFRRAYQRMTPGEREELLAMLRSFE